MARTAGVAITNGDQSSLVLYQLTCDQGQQFLGEVTQ